MTASSRVPARSRAPDPPARRARAAGAIAALLAAVAAGDAGSAGGSAIEGGAIYYDLSEGLDSTYGEYARGRLETSHSDAWTADITSLNRFGDHGTQFTLGNTHEFDERWYTRIYVTGSAGGFFWPRVRVDASASRKWLAERRLVTTLGSGYFDAKDPHEDFWAFVEAAYWFAAPWVIQGGVQHNVSTPGSVHSTSGYAAASHVRQGTRIVSVRGAAGRQAYQALAADNFVVDFPFRSIRLTWREWIGHSWGINLAAEHYSSKPYDQSGFELGFFKEF